MVPRQISETDRALLPSLRFLIPSRCRARYARPGASGEIGIPAPAAGWRPGSAGSRDFSGPERAAAWS